MKYTVNRLATLSGVSVRTLHYYDEIGLLKPAYYGDNNYRYYEEPQLWLLQQILFFRELNFPLNEIQRIMASDDFNKIESLISHKHLLEKKLEKAKILIQTIDKTISHLRGKIKMQDNEIYEGFDAEKQQAYEKYLIDNGTLTQKEIDESWMKARNWKKKNWDEFKKEGDEINRALVEAMNKTFEVSSPEVQQIVARHYEWVKNFVSGLTIGREKRVIEFFE